MDINSADSHYFLPVSGGQLSEEHVDQRVQLADLGNQNSAKVAEGNVRVLWLSIRTLNTLDVWHHLFPVVVSESRLKSLLHPLEGNAHIRCPPHLTTRQSYL